METDAQIRALYSSIDSCPLCDSIDFEVIRQERNSFPNTTYFEPYQGATVSLRKCLSCGFAFVDTFPLDTSFFSELYCHGCDMDFEFNFHGKRLIFEHAKNHILRHARIGGELLDIGAWLGTFISYMQDSFQVQGIEIDEAAAAFCRKRGLRVAEGSVDTAQFEDDAFDVVSLIDVLEHLPSPRTILARLQRWLKPGGILFIKVPNYLAQASKQNFLNRTGLSKVGIMENFIHINHFTRDSLSKCLVQLGFEILECGFAPTEIYDLSVPTSKLTYCRRLLSNVVKESGTSLAMLVSRLFNVEAGFNLYVVARKKG